MKIQLTDIEVQLAKIMSKVIEDRSIVNGYDKSKKRDDRSHFDISVDGFGAELAVAKALDIYPSLDSVFTKVDLTYNGQTINVKHTKYTTGRLLVPDYQGKTTDWYVLVTGVIPDLHIRGFAHADEVFREENIGDLGKGKSYIMEQYQLIPLEEWLDA